MTAPKPAPLSSKRYTALLRDIQKLLRSADTANNTQKVHFYWHVGERIVSEEGQGDGPSWFTRLLIGWGGKETRTDRPSRRGRIVRRHGWMDAAPGWKLTAGGVLGRNRARSPERFEESPARVSSGGVPASAGWAHWCAGLGDDRCPQKMSFGRFSTRV